MVYFNNGSPHVQPTKLAKCIETRQLGVGTTTIDLSTLVGVFSQVSRNGHMNDVRGAYVWLHACRSFLDGCSLDILGCVDIVNSCIATSARETHQYPESIQTPDYEVTLCGVCSACTRQGYSGVSLQTPAWQIIKRAHHDIDGHMATFETNGGSTKGRYIYQASHWV